MIRDSLAAAISFRNEITSCTLASFNSIIRTSRTGETNCCTCPITLENCCIPAGSPITSRFPDTASISISTRPCCSRGSPSFRRVSNSSTRARTFAGSPAPAGTTRNSRRPGSSASSCAINRSSTPCCPGSARTISVSSSSSGSNVGSWYADPSSGVSIGRANRSSRGPSCDGTAVFSAYARLSTSTTTPDSAVRSNCSNRARPARVPISVTLRLAPSSVARTGSRSASPVAASSSCARASIAAGSPVAIRTTRTSTSAPERTSRPAIRPSSAATSAGGPATSKPRPSGVAVNRTADCCRGVSIRDRICSTRAGSTCFNATTRPTLSAAGRRACPVSAAGSISPISALACASNDCDATTLTLFTVPSGTTTGFDSCGTAAYSALSRCAASSGVIVSSANVIICRSPVTPSPGTSMIVMSSRTV
ncbi:MAG: hypothetical protein AMXMBFR77_04980 [Phycisphaerales bacterium]